MIERVISTIYTYLRVIQLISRFSIPDPPPLVDTTNDVDVDPATTIIRDDLKRFRLEYKKPIQIR